jgi:serine phosphatase RsbU (regulator of sigma subunit)
MSRIADVAQQAILPPVPERLGHALTATRYVSAAQDAAVGGDFYEAAMYKDEVRFVVGDVRGKGLEAVRLAAVVLGTFREAAESLPTLTEIVSRMDDRLRRHLEEEDFVTAVVGSLARDGTLYVVNSGHPGPVLVATGRPAEHVRYRPTTPLGLAPVPVPATANLRPGDRLVVFTDGLVERRAPGGADLDPITVAKAAVDAPSIRDTASAVLAKAMELSEQDVVDDLALLILEYAPEDD